MKKVLVSLVSLSLLAAPVIALAQEEPDMAYEIPEDLEVCCGDGTLLDVIVDWIFAFVLIVAAMGFITAGYFFITAAGDPDKTKKARDFVLYAIVGVIVAFAAKGLIYLVATMTGAV